MPLRRTSARDGGSHELAQRVTHRLPVDPELPRNRRLRDVAVVTHLDRHDFLPDRPVCHPTVAPVTFSRARTNGFGLWPATKRPASAIAFTVGLSNANGHEDTTKPRLLSPTGCLEPSEPCRGTNGLQRRRSGSNGTAVL